MYPFKNSSYCKFPVHLSSEIEKIFASKKGSSREKEISVKTILRENHYLNPSWWPLIHFLRRVQDLLNFISKEMLQ